MAPLFFAAMTFPSFLKYGNLFFVDLRRQEMISSGNYSFSAVLLAAGAALLVQGGVFEWFRRSGRNTHEYISASLPLAGMSLFYFFDYNFLLFFYAVFLWAWSAARCGSLVRLPPPDALTPRRTLLILSVLVLLWATAGFWQQMRALNTMSMSWFDWGHFFESLYNTLKGKPFYLNLSGGSFLASRFTPSLLLLFPAAATGSVPLFLFTGSLLVSSGALFVYLISRTLNGSVREAFFMGVLYFFIPGVANMNLPLIDGFHEVFMLFPLYLCTIWFALKKWYIPAGIFFFLTLGVRETAGVILAGAGIVLFFRGKKKWGALCFAAAALYVFAALKIFMPLFGEESKETYTHVRYFSHLGKNMFELALSPFLKSKLFFSTLFTTHNLLFFLTLLLPFIFLCSGAWYWCLLMLPELIILCLDRRFDTQSVLRHYQISCVLTLITASLAGAAKMRSEGVPELLKKIFWKLKTPDCRHGLFAAAAVSSVISCAFFVHFPGLPCSEPQRRYSAPAAIPLWEDARPALNQIKQLIPKGASVTAGPRPGAMLLPDYDIHFDFSDERKLKDHVLVENFFSFYFPEDKVSRLLLTSPRWELIWQGFVDERSLQLFRRRAVQAPPRRNVVNIELRQWERWGIPIPCAASDLQIRGAVTGNREIHIGVRLQKKRKNDAGFRVETEFASGKKMKYFTSFGNGRFPADLANPGEGFFFSVKLPAEENITACRVSVVELASGEKAPL